MQFEINYLALDLIPHLLFALQSADVAVAVAAIRALTLVIRNSSAQTIMGLSKELEEAAQALQR